MVLICIFLFIAFIAQSYAAGISGLSLVVAYNVWAWRRVALFPITTESASTAAQVSWWVLAIAALVKIFSS